MTYEERQIARQARNLDARQKLSRSREMVKCNICTGCGGEYGNVTAGCIQCTDRARARAKRREVRLLAATARGSTVNRRAHVRGVTRMLDKAGA